MKLGISDFAFPSNWSLDRIFATAAEVGFDGVELGLSENGSVSLNSTMEEMQNIRKLADKYGIKLYSLASMLAWNDSLTSDHSEEREKAKANVKKQLELAHYLGCDTVLVVPGYVGVDFIPNCEVVAYDTVYARAVEWVNELKACAEEWKVSIGVENVWNKFLLSPLEMRDFIDKADSDYVGAYFDVGNVVYSGYPEQWIRILGNRIRKIHLKDFKRSIGTIDGFVNLLEGDVDYPAVMSALKEIHYDGWLTAEYSFSEEEFEKGIHRTIDAMRKIVHV